MSLESKKSAEWWKKKTDDFECGIINNDCGSADRSNIHKLAHEFSGYSGYTEGQPEPTSEEYEVWIRKARAYLSRVLSSDEQVDGADLSLIIVSALVFGALYTSARLKGMGGAEDKEEAGSEC